MNTSCAPIRPIPGILRNVFFKQRSTKAKKPIGYVGPDSIIADHISVVPTNDPRLTAVKMQECFNYSL